MTDREKGMVVALVLVAVAGATLMNAVNAVSLKREADIWQERYLAARPIAERMSVVVAEKEARLQAARQRPDFGSQQVSDAYELGEAVGEALRASGAEIRGYTMPGGTKASMVEYSARLDAKALASFLARVDRIDPPIIPEFFSLSVTKDGYLELSTRIRYALGD